MAQKLIYIFRLTALLLVLGSVVHAAEESRLGTIEFLNQDNGSLTISGVTLKFSDRVTKVFLRGEPVGAEVIDVGMVVRYTLDSSGVLSRVELIGPADKLRMLEQN